MSLSITLYLNRLASYGWKCWRKSLRQNFIARDLKSWSCSSRGERGMLNRWVSWTTPVLAKWSGPETDARHLLFGVCEECIWVYDSDPKLFGAESCQVGSVFVISKWKTGNLLCCFIIHSGKGIFLWCRYFFKA